MVVMGMPSEVDHCNVECKGKKRISQSTNVKPKEDYPSVSYLELFKYATLQDKLSILIATILCTITAVCQSVIAFTFGEVTGTVVDYVYVVTNNTNQTAVEEATQELMEDLNWFVATNCCLGTTTLIFTYIATLLFNFCALRQTCKIRELFLSKILDQDIPWYDVHQTGDFASRVADDLTKIEEGMGEKVATFIFYEVTCVSSILQALIMGWKLALVCMVSFPISTASMGFIAWISSKLAKQEMESYGEAATVAEEALTAIKTVVAFDGQKKEEERYNSLLLSARDNNIKRSLFNGISNSIMWFFSYAGMSLSFWYGVQLILDERNLPKDQMTYDAGRMITVFFGVLTGTWHFRMASPFIETFGVAKGAAAKIFAIIASQPKINASKNKGMKPEEIKGNIVFKNVHFSYPSRKEVTVLRGLTLTIKSGETVAFVGSSGCGKSTCIQLIQRYYDPVVGHICIDENKITDLNLTWLRSHIGVVGQEPVLFEATIAENIKFGCETATQEDVEKAARKANAHTFISFLPRGYNTMVGERGAQLSGGQKQRIAIARAIIRNPTILLLDEATSALDANSEAIVQAALDAACNDCTTIIVAHRLSTVRKADRIVVISEGVVKEQGSHTELMSRKAAYYDLVRSQASPENGVSYDEKKIEFDPQKNMDDTNGTVLHDLPQCEEITKKGEKLEPISSLLLTIMNISPEWSIIFIGCISSIITGAGIPVYAVVLGNVVGILSDNDEAYIQEQANKYSLYFLCMGIVIGIATLFQIYMFGVAGEKLTMQLRSRMFKAILSQEMAWFDKKDQGVGALCARLSGETASVQGATGQLIGTILNSMSTIIFAIAISVYFEWRVTLVCFCLAPLIILFIFVEKSMATKSVNGYHESLERSTKIAVEAVGNIRTVAALGCEAILQDLYMREVMSYQNSVKNSTYFRGIVYAVARSLLFFAHAATFYFGGTLVRDRKVDYGSVFIAVESILISSWSLASALAFAPNFQKGISSTSRIVKLLKRTPRIQSHSDDANERWQITSLNYENVYFSYPTRPTVGVLKGLDLAVLKGKTVALVGPSGCGKTTIMQLLGRFYDPTYGKVTADGRDIKEMHLSALRSHLGIVSQEPNLFSRTIADNIAYGDNTRTVSREAIIDAAKKANIHNFITSLPLGYDTKLGEKGSQLSGGQKQRVAIARALVRNPKVLLLDEATSALDAESEKVVQEALDNAKVGTTCISIAHRLTTIQDADLICVINHGRVAEMGTHSELLNLKGIYCNLHSLQNGCG